MKAENEAPYWALRTRVGQELAGRPGETYLPAVQADPLVRQLGRLIREARRIIQVIDQILPQAFPEAGVRDRNRYSSILAMLDRIAEFQSFSLAEYVYHLPGGRPGARLLLEEKDWARRLTVIFFENIGQWQVDWQGRRISYELLAFDLEGPEPRPLVAPEAAEYFQDGWSWEEHLQEALCLPVRLILLPD
jgi:hypothetical protein